MQQRKLWEGLPDYNFQSLLELAYRQSTIYIDSALCLITYGDLNLALDMLHTVRKHHLHLQESQRAKAPPSTAA